MIENFALFIIRYRGIDISAYSLVSFSQGLSAMVQYFLLRTNQHQPGLSAQKPTSEQADKALRNLCDTLVGDQSASND